MLDSTIILSARQPDVVNALARGTQAAQMQNDFQRERQLNALLMAQGDKIASGDQNALNALARFDPNAALGIQGTRQDQRQSAGRFEMDQESHALNTQFTQQRTTALGADQRRAAEAHAARLSTAEVAAQRDELKRDYAVMAAGQSAEEWDRLAEQTGNPDLTGMFEDRESVLARVMEVDEVLARQEQQAPLSPQGKFFEDQRLGFIPADVPAPSSGGSSATEEKIARLEETGLTREQAIGVADGRFVPSRDPVSGMVTVIDKATGEPVGANRNPGRRANGLPGIAPVTTTELRSDLPLQSSQSTNPSQTGARLPQSSMPEGVDFSTATGARGFAVQLGNTIADAVGAGLIDQNNERATQAMNNLATRTMVALSGAVAGRPSNYLLEQFERLSARPNSVFMGEGRTFERLSQTRDMIQAAIQENLAITQSSNVSPSIRGQAGENIQRLGLLLQDYNVVIDGFGQSRDQTSNSGQTSGGVTWRVVE